MAATNRMRVQRGDTTVLVQCHVAVLTSCMTLHGDCGGLGGFAWQRVVPWKRGQSAARPLLVLMCAPLDSTTLPPLRLCVYILEAALRVKRSQLLDTTPVRATFQCL